MQEKFFIALIWSSLIPILVFSEFLARRFLPVFNKQGIHVYDT